MGDKSQVLEAVLKETVDLVTLTYIDLNHFILMSFLLVSCFFFTNGFFFFNEFVNAGEHTH